MHRLDRCASGMVRSIPLIIVVCLIGWGCEKGDRSTATSGQVTDAEGAAIGAKTQGSDSIPNYTVFVRWLNDIHFDIWEEKIDEHDGSQIKTSYKEEFRDGWLFLSRRCNDVLSIQFSHGPSELESGLAALLADDWTAIKRLPGSKENFNASLKTPHKVGDLYVSVHWAADSSGGKYLEELIVYPATYYEQVIAPRKQD